nr:angiopoietin-related protein 7-like isoform X1 [Procambarus clarkii]
MAIRMAWEMTWMMAWMLWTPNTPAAVSQHPDYLMTLPEDPLQPIWERLESITQEITKAVQTQMQNHFSSARRDSKDLSMKLSALEDKFEHAIDDLRLEIIEEIDDKLATVDESVRERLHDLSAVVNSSSDTLAAVNTHLTKLDGGAAVAAGLVNCTVLVDRVAEVLNVQSSTREPQSENCSQDPETFLDAETMAELKSALGRMRESSAFLPRDCSDLHWQQPEVPSGVFLTYPTMNPKASVSTWCDMGQESAKATGGWNVILRRRNTTWGLIDFNRTWSEYRAGFGMPGEGEWWYGLDSLHALTYRQPYEVRILMHDIEMGYFQAMYSTFRVEDESSNYRLIMDGFSGNVTVDPVATHHHGQPFSTHDRDNDDWTAGNCAATNGGGWWYSRCHRMSLTASFPRSADRNERTIRWLNNGWLVLDDVTLMIRPAGYGRRFQPPS